MHFISNKLQSMVQKSLWTLNVLQNIIIYNIEKDLLLLQCIRIIIIIYYIDTSVLLENIPLVKFIKTTSGTRLVYFP